MPVCKGCGGSYEDRFMFCTYCGRAKPETPQIEINVRVSEEAGKLTCPSCHRADKAQKVSAIIASQTHAIGAEILQSQVKGFQTSLLVQKLSQVPGKPKPVKGIGEFTFYGYVSILAGIAGIGVAISARNWEPRFYIGLVAAVLFGILGNVFLTTAKKKKLAVEEAQTQAKLWETAMRKYNDLFYCAGCDCVYTPGIGTFALVKDMTAYLYSD